MTANMPLVSIITPVYNAESYLRECIESVLSQTYENWEYLIVDNCSNDNSLTIAEFYAKKDKRIRIIHNKQFLSIIPNWNHAMRNMVPESKYCKVVHADDWIFPECIEKMVGLCEEYPSIGIASAYRLEEEKVGLQGVPYSDKFLKGKQVCRLILLDGFQLFGSPTSIIYRADLIRNKKKFYNEDNLHADLEVCFELMQSNDFGFVHQVLTFTRRHNESETSKAKFFNTNDVSKFLLIKRYGPEYLDNREFQFVMKKYINSYYEKVAWKVAKLWLIERSPRRNEYLNFQKSRMKEIGLPFRYSLLTRQVILNTYRYCLNRLMLV
jgi:glycosyltransferase involved in cell wall biosynthesis